VLQLLLTDTGYLNSLISPPEDGGDIFLQTSISYKSQKARRHITEAGGGHVDCIAVYFKHKAVYFELSSF
jgi:hypothetical protein